MKLNVSVPALTLAGEPMTENDKIIMLNQVLANRLFTMDSKEKAIEMYLLACKIYKAKGEIEIDEAEKAMIKEATSTLIVAFSAQIQIIINNAK